MHSLTNQIRRLALPCLVIITLLTVGCATESHRAVPVAKVNSYNSSFSGQKTTLVVGKFQNRSSYLQGLFSTDSDRLGNQSKTILKTHLQQTNRFTVVDRESLVEIGQEAQMSGINQQLDGARYVVTGDVTEFGRKVTGNRQLFGILGAGKTQVAYAKVSINIVDVASSRIVYSTQGAGEYELSNQEVLGTGGTAGYDATLNGKVLNFAITEAVNNIVTDIDNGNWKIDF
jgi:curli biogenesis system outer membrane secretion channel CsgG